MITTTLFTRRPKEAKTTIANATRFLLRVRGEGEGCRWGGVLFTGYVQIRSKQELAD
jgi:hypothetical protein